MVPRVELPLSADVKFAGLAKSESVIVDVETWCTFQKLIISWVTLSYRDWIHLLKFRITFHQCIWGSIQLVLCFDHIFYHNENESSQLEEYRGLYFTGLKGSWVGKLGLTWGKTYWAISQCSKAAAYLVLYEPSPTSWIDRINWHIYCSNYWESLYIHYISVVHKYRKADSEMSFKIWPDASCFSLDLRTPSQQIRGVVLKNKTTTYIHGSFNCLLIHQSLASGRSPLVITWMQNNHIISKE